MSLTGRILRGLGDTNNELVPLRSRGTGRRSLVSGDALSHSGVWACLRLRADLLSTMPLTVYRQSPAAGFDVALPVPASLKLPGGPDCGITEYLYSSQFDLDRCGNSFGLITERTGAGLPARVDLVPYTDVTVKMTKGVLSYRIGQETYAAKDVWHERQFTSAGIPVGLSPLTYAALSVSNYLSASEFAADWFSNGAVPSGTFKNTKKSLTPAEAAAMKTRFREAVRAREPLVHGADWEYSMISVAANESMFLESMRAGVSDVCRFFGVPGDMIDAEGGASNVTYANVTQRNLQLLIMHLAPAIIRREEALSRWLPGPQKVRLVTDSVLRMDPAARNLMIGLQVKDRTLTPNEARALNNLPPYTAEQYDEFLILFPPKGLALPTTYAAAEQGVTP